MKEEKLCRKCNTIKPLDEMVKSKAYKDGYLCYCKLCTKNLSTKFRENNPITQMISGTKSSAKKRGIEFSLVESDIIIPEKCVYLDLILTNEVGKGLLPSAATIDRIDNTKGYHKDNIMIISHQANKIKEALSIDELILFSKNVLKHFDK